MAQRSKLQLSLNNHSKEAIKLTTLRLTAVSWTDLQAKFVCPPDYNHATAFSVWACGHPAVGPGIKAVYRAKWTQPRLTAHDMPGNMQDPLQNALCDYTFCLLDNVLSDMVRAKTTNIMQTDGRLIWQYLHRRLTAGLTPGNYGTAWWVGFKIHPDNVDLINRNEFARVLYYTNLTITTDKPLETECVNIFDYAALRSHPNYAATRDKNGRFAEDNSYE